MKNIFLISLMLVITFQNSDSANRYDRPHHHHDNCSKFLTQKNKRAVETRPIDFTKLEGKIKYDVAVKYFEYLKKTYGNVEILSFGKTEKSKKQIKGVRVFSTAQDQKNKDKPIIFICAGIRGDKHIHTTTALYGIYQLAELPYLNREIITYFDFVIIPVVNPDGYDAGTYHNNKEYEWIEQERRGQGKDTHYVTVTRTCPGTNIYLNWRSYWTRNRRECTGEISFSASETKALRSAMEQFQEKAVLYIELSHTGKAITYPYSCDKNRIIDKMPTVDAIAKAATISMRECNGTGTNYSVMQEYYYNNKQITNTPTDYVLDAVGIPLVFKFYLPETVPTAEGGKTSNLQPRVYEAWCGIADMCFETYIQVIKGDDAATSAGVMPSFLIIFLFCDVVAVFILFAYVIVFK